MFQEERQTVKFEWSHPGDIQLGRPNLGNTTTVAVYRPMQFTIRDAIIKHRDPRKARRAARHARHARGFEKPADAHRG